MSTVSPAGQETQEQVERFRASGLNAALTVKDLDTTVAWYRDAVGFAVHQRYERQGKVMSVAMRAGGVRILLNQDDGARGLDRTVGEGISLQIATRESVDEVAERIRAYGWKLETEPADMPWGARAFRVVDPDGFKFAISTER